ncbi:MAG: hypothetical protein ABR985_08205 [Methanotrichaceae archaeon]
MLPLSEALSSEMFLMPSASLFLKGTATPDAGLVDLVRGYERARGKA